MARVTVSELGGGGRLVIGLLKVGLEVRTTANVPSRIFK